VVPKNIAARTNITTIDFLNRQYLIAFRAIKEVEHYFARKLSISLKVPTDKNLLVGKDKATQFLSWLDQR
jgi:two-component system response regulator LytT